MRSARTTSISWLVASTSWRLQSRTREELWTLRGGKPELFADILEGPQGSDAYNFAEFGNKLYFAADDGLHGYEIWSVSNRTSAKMKILSGKVRVSRAGKVKVRLKCPPSGESGSCVGKLTLKVKGKGKVGGTGFKVRAGKTRKVTLKLKKGRSGWSGRKRRRKGRLLVAKANGKTVRERVRLTTG